MGVYKVSERWDKTLFFKSYFVISFMKVIARA